jgi:hypothetical protein
MGFGGGFGPGFGTGFARAEGSTPPTPTPTPTLRRLQGLRTTGVVEVYNLALSIISVAEIIENPDDTSHTAKTLRRFWPTALELTLRDFPWACARKSRAMTLHDQDVPGWQYCYNYPNDCVFALAVMPATGLRASNVWIDSWERATNLRPPKYPFERQLRDDNNNQVIASDLVDAYLLYIARVENPVVFDIGLVVASAAMLGRLAGPTLKVKRDFVEYAQQTYEIERARAAANDLNEGAADPEPMTPSLAARC